MVIFFDLDDTLYDRARPFMDTYKSIYEDKDEDFLRKLYDACNYRGDQVFLPAQKKDITMEQMYIYRYCNGFTDMGLHLDAKGALDFQTKYIEMQQKIKPSKGIIESLIFCKNSYEDVGIITNGPGKNQRQKISSLRIEDWLNPELIIISGEVNTAKPDTKIFEIAASKCCKSPGDFLYVGDNLERDILPAMQLGWHTVWLNLKSEDYPETLKAKPDYIITSTATLQEVLKNFITLP